MKKAGITAVQALITCALLIWIFHDPERRAMMWEAVQTANWWWFFPGFAAIGLTLFLQTFRWKWLLAVQGIRPSFRRTYGMNMIGMFFNLFLPGGTGGDLVKMYYASREAVGKKPAAVLSVFMDRVMGLLALIAIAAIVCALAFEQLWVSPAMRGILTAIGMVTLGALGFLILVFVIEFFHLSKRLPHWLPLRSAILEMAAAFSLYARSRSILLYTFLISILTHCLIFFSFYFAALAFTDALSVVDLFVVLPSVLTIASLPISVAGLGVREELFRVSLGAVFGVPGGVAVLIGFSGFLLAVAWGIVGGIIYVFYRPSDKEGVSISAIEREMEITEKEIGDQEENRT